MTRLDEYDDATAEFARLCGLVPLDGLDSSTPCTDWNLRQLINHVVTGTHWFATVVRGEDQPDRSIDQVKSDPVGAFQLRADEFRAAISAPGAMEASYRHAIATVDGASYTLMRVNEFLCHGADIARTVGAEPHFDDGVARDCRELYAQRLFAGRERAELPNFGTPRTVPDEASEYSRLLAYFGRDPGAF